MGLNPGLEGKTKKELKWASHFPFSQHYKRDKEKRRHGRKKGGRLGRMGEGDVLKRVSIMSPLHETSSSEKNATTLLPLSRLSHSSSTSQQQKLMSLGIRNCLRSWNTMSLKGTFLEAWSGSWTLWGSGTACLTSCLKKHFYDQNNTCLWLVKIGMWSRLLLASPPLITHYVHSLVCIVMCVFLWIFTYVFLCLK